MGSDVLVCDLAEPPGSNLSTNSKTSTLSTIPQPCSSEYLTNSSLFFAQSEILRSFTQKTEHSFRTIEFRNRFYPNVSEAQWNNWRWQVKNRICSVKEVERIFSLTQAERDAFTCGTHALPVAITPYYASIIDPDDVDSPLRKMVIPVRGELLRSHGEAEDPLGEANQSPVPGLVHRYPDRVLFLTTNVCASYCRYCTRSRMVGESRDCHGLSRQTWDAGIEYIANHPEVRDVLLSGGDPLMLPDESLRYLLTRLRAIEHVEIIRIGTKVPIVLPQRITSSLVHLLKQFAPIFASIHCTHADEITPEVKDACGKLADAGVPLGSQTVLLAGINDDAQILKRLFHGLLKIRVRPYYLYQCDPILGSAHFRTPVTKGIDLIRQLRGFTSGYAIPTYVIDAPGGGGKIPITPDYVLGHEGSSLLLKNYQDNVYQYPDIVG